MPTYATVASLRADPNVPDGTPPTDSDLAAKLDEAEDLVDRLIGPGGVDVTTDRKLVVAALTAWQASRLSRATVLLAAELYRNPDAFIPQGAERIQGPDFMRQGINANGPAPRTAYVLRRAVALLDGAGLRRITARLR